jgi:hypothetical protein
LGLLARDLLLGLVQLAFQGLETVVDLKKRNPKMIISINTNYLFTKGTLPAKNAYYFKFEMHIIL